MVLFLANRTRQIPSETFVSSKGGARMDTVILAGKPRCGAAFVAAPTTTPLGEPPRRDEVDLDNT